MEDLIFSLIETISWPGAVALVMFLAYKSGLFGALSKKLANGKSSPESDTRIKDLEDFKLEAETNHFHDLNELKSDMKELKNEIVLIRERLVRLETKLNGNAK